MCHSMKFILTCLILTIAFAQEEENIEWEQYNFEGSTIDDVTIIESGESNIPPEVAAKLRILNDDDYCVIKKPELFDIARQHVQDNYKAVCDYNQTFDRILYIGSGVLENGIKFLVQALLSDGKQYEFQVEFTDYDKGTDTFQKKFEICRLLEQDEMHDLSYVPEDL